MAISESSSPRGLDSRGVPPSWKPVHKLSSNTLARTKSEKKEHFLIEYDREKAGVIEQRKGYVLFCPTVERHCLNLG